jgi:hypothetical protein
LLAPVVFAELGQRIAGELVGADTATLQSVRARRVDVRRPRSSLARESSPPRRVLAERVAVPLFEVGEPGLGREPPVAVVDPVTREAAGTDELERGGAVGIDEVAQLIASICKPATT